MKKNLPILYCYSSSITTKRIRQMQTQYINEMLDIPALQINHIIPMSTDEIHIEVTPVAQKNTARFVDQMNLSRLKEAMNHERSSNSRVREKKCLSWFQPFGCIARNVRQVLFGGMNMSSLKNGTEIAFESGRFSKHLAPQQRIAPACNKRLSARYTNVQRSCFSRM